MKLVNVILLVLTSLFRVKTQLEESTKQNFLISGMPTLWL